MTQSNGVVLKEVAAFSEVSLNIGFTVYQCVYICT